MGVVVVVAVLATFYVLIFTLKVLWDKIVMRGEKALLDLKSVKTKYYFRDMSGALSGENITLTLSWNTMPNMGHLTWVKVYYCSLVIDPLTHSGR